MNPFVASMFWYWDVAVYAWLQMVYAPAFAMQHTVPQYLD